ncbi:MAG: hypothetical protein GXO32_06935 [Crenarchaeota archaeon]|nr:hypothetical protein [Thermoproteota archaeon]
MKVYFRFADARLWRYVLRGLAEYLDVIGIKVHPEEGVRIKAMDPSHVMLVDFEIPKTAFDEFEIDQETVLAVNLELSSKVLRRATKNDKLVISSDGSKISFGLVSKGGVERYFTLPLLSAKFEEIPELSLELNIEAKTLGPTFATALSVLEKAGDVLRIKAGAEGLSLIATSELGEIEFEFSVTTGTLIDYKPPEGEEVVNSYSLEYFDLLAKVSKMSESITIKLGPDMPCEIDAELPSGAVLRTYIAPRVE